MTTTREHRTVVRNVSVVRLLAHTRRLRRHITDTRMPTMATIILTHMRTIRVRLLSGFYGGYGFGPRFGGFRGFRGRLQALNHAINKRELLRLSVAK